MKYQEMAEIIPIAAPRSKVRKETFGAMLISGDLPILRINDDAVAVWELCDGKRSIDEIAQILKEIFEIEGLIPRLEEYFTFFLENGILLDARAVSQRKI